VTLSDKQKMDTITVRNDGAEPVSMQLEVLNWSKEEGNGCFYAHP
jgi:P pilus assembly chaperone PapD